MPRSHSDSVYVYWGRSSTGDGEDQGRPSRSWIAFRRRSCRGSWDRTRSPWMPYLLSHRSMTSTMCPKDRGSSAPDVERPNNALKLEFWKALYRINKQWNGPQKMLSFAVGGHLRASQKVQSFLSGGAGLGVAPRSLNDNEAKVASEFCVRVTYHYRAASEQLAPHGCFLTCSCI